ncbi:MAG: hypothetical protein LBF83_03390 [Spirochaetaceae bacterium]|jgi:hypothetical protein|nr:hypothetical protein [Spirochaetaceae bacterium]
MRKRLFSLFGITLLGAVIFTQTAYAQEQADGPVTGRQAVTAGLGLALTRDSDDGGCNIFPE